MHGFTMVELIAVMLMIGILAAIGIPRLVDGYGYDPTVHRDQVLSGLRMAQKAATARRRVVCASVAGNALVLRVATATGVPAACTAAVAGVEDDDYRSRRDGVTSALAGGATMLYFMPDGTITTDAQGQNPVNDAVVIKAGGIEQFRIAVDGRSGHVE